MALSNRDRKLLWGRSGNRCALCRQELSFDVRDGGAAVMGDEARIVGERPGSPRWEEHDQASGNRYENFILLCRIDHARVDELEADQFTATELRRLKATHEQWVSDRLTDGLPTRSDMDEILDELDNDLPADPAAFLAAFVQEEGNVGGKYFALAESLIDEHGVAVVAGFAAIVRDDLSRVDPWLTARNLRERLGHEFEALYERIGNRRRFVEVLETVIGGVTAADDGVALPPSPAPLTDEEIVVRERLTAGDVAGARDLVAFGGGGGAVVDELALLFGSGADRDPDTAWLLATWRCLAAGSEFDFSARPVASRPMSQDPLPIVPAGRSAGTETVDLGGAPPITHGRTPERGPAMRAGERGEVLEQGMLRLLRHLVDVDSDGEEHVIQSLRKQRAGTQYGYDLSLTAMSAGRWQGRCHIECKNYRDLISLGTVTEKLAQQELHWADAPIDHWILVSPHVGVNNELDKYLEWANRTGRYQFTIQVWSPEEKVEELFALQPEIHELIYDRPAPTIGGAKQAAIITAWRDRLRPVQRIAEPLRRYLDDPELLCLPAENAGTFDDLFAHHLTPTVVDDRGVALRESCEERVRRWLERPEDRSLVVFGKFGDGKSFLTYLLARRLNEEFKADPEQGWFAIRLALRDLRPSADANEFLARRLGSFGVSIGQWNQLARTHRTLVIFDGLDEMSSGLDPDDLSRNLRALGECLEVVRPSKVLVTTRDGIYDSGHDAERLADVLGSPERLHLAAATRYDLVLHLDEYADRVGMTPKMEHLKGLYDPIGIAAKPLFLEMIKATLDDLPEEEFDEIVLYETYVDKSLRRKIELLRDTAGGRTDREIVEGLGELLEEMALELHRTSTTELSLESWRSSAPQGMADWLWSFGREPTAEQRPGTGRTVAVRSLLEPVRGSDESDRTVAFCHRSMAEFFLARRIARAVRAGVADAISVLSGPGCDTEVIGFAVSLLHRDRNPAHRTTLSEVALGCRRGSNGVAGGTAVSLLYALTGDVSGVQWEGLDLDGVRLPGADLRGVSLRGSSLRGAVLDGADLSSADLRDVDLTGVRLEAATAVTAAVFHDGAVVAGYADGTVRVWRRDGASGRWLVRSVVELGGDDIATSVWVTPGGRVVVVGRDLYLWERELSVLSDQPLARFRIRRDVAAVRFSSDGRLLVSWHGGSFTTGTVVDLATMTVEFGRGIDDALALAVRDRLLYLREFAAGVVFDDWATTPDRVRHVSNVADVISVDVARRVDGLLVVSGSERGAVLIERIGDDEDAVATDSAGAHRGPVTAVALDGARLLSGGSDGLLAVTELDNSGRPVDSQRLTLAISCQGVLFDGVAGPVEYEMLRRLSSND